MISINKTSTKSVNQSQHIGNNLKRSKIAQHFTNSKAKKEENTIKMTVCVVDDVPSTLIHPEIHGHGEV